MTSDPQLLAHSFIIMLVPLGGPPQGLGVFEIQGWYPNRPPRLLTKTPLTLRQAKAAQKAAIAREIGRQIAAAAEAERLSRLAIAALRDDGSDGGDGGDGGMPEIDEPPNHTFGW